MINQRWIQSNRVLLLPMLMVFLFSFNAWSDQEQRRASYVETVNEEQIQTQTLRGRIITTRTLSLYLEDLLPSMGSPYKHLAQFVSDTTLSSFKEAQRYSGSEMNQKKWSPLEPGKFYLVNSSPSLPVVKYLSDWVASVKVQNAANVIMRSSIVVESIQNTLSPEKLAKYNRAVKLLSYMVGKIESELQGNPNLIGVMRESQRKSYVLLTAFTAKQMAPYLHYVETPQNREATQGFLKKIEASAKGTSFDSTEAKKIKQRVKALMKSPEYKTVSATLDSVDLPESGDIFGSDESFEAVMRLEVGFDLIKAIYLNVDNW